MARRRKYTRRRKSLTIPVGGIAIGAATFAQLNGLEATEQIMRGNVRGAVGALAANSVTDVLVASIPPMLYGYMKKAMGPVTLFQIGKIRITI